MEELRNKVENFLNQIFKDEKVYDENGQEHKLNANLSKEEGLEIVKIFNENIDYYRTIEVGCAQGISSLYICKSIFGRDNSKHIIIDPFQSSEWKNIGITNLKSCGLDNFELIQKKSEFALPFLLEENNKFDFALIDGNHTFDHCLVDFFYLEQMIVPGGVIAIDDTSWPSLSKLIKYISQYPNIQIIGNVRLPDINDRSKKREEVLEFSRNLLGRIIPKKYHKEILSSKSSTKVNWDVKYSSMVFLKKTHDLKRHWTWYESF